MNKMDGCDIIIIAKLFTLIRNYRYGMDGYTREKFNEINEQIDNKVPNTIQEYNFFDGLHVQTPEDDVISLIKIMERLEIEIPSIPIDTQNIEDSYQLVWEVIGQGMNITPEMALKIAELATIFLNRYEERIANENVDYCTNLYKNYRKTLKIVEDENTIIDNKPQIYRIVNEMIENYINYGIPEDIEVIHDDIFDQFSNPYGRWYCRVILNEIVRILKI